MHGNKELYNQTITTQHLNIIIQHFQHQLTKAEVILEDIDIIIKTSLRLTNMIIRKRS